MNVKKEDIMKKIITFITVILFIAGINTHSIKAATPIKVYVDNNEIQFDQSPVIKNGRTLIPFRPVLEHIGAYVSWNGATKTVTAKYNEKTISMKINDHYAYVNGVKTKMDTAPIILNGRTLIPLRFISESLGAEVHWNATEKLVDIYTWDLLYDKFHQIDGEANILQEKTEWEFNNALLSPNEEHVNSMIWQSLLEDKQIYTSVHYALRNIDGEYYGVYMETDGYKSGEFISGNCYVTLFDINTNEEVGYSEAKFDEVIFSENVKISTYMVLRDMGYNVQN
jgi:hypothetical protein